MDSVNLNGHNFDFDLKFFIVKNSGRNESAEWVTIDTGPIAKFHIEEDLYNPGITGHIAVKNQAQFLERIKAIRTTEDTVYIDVTIIDRSSKSENPVDKTISFLALLETSTSIGSNIVDNVIVFEFEEAITSMLKKTSMKNLFPSWSKQTNDGVGLYLDEILRTWVAFALPGTPFEDIVDVSRWYKNSGQPGNIQAFWWDVEDSVYDVLYRLSESIQLTNGNKIRLPILKLKKTLDESESSGISRKFTFEEVFTDRHHEFLRAYKTGAGGIYDDVYLEDFTITPETPQGPNSGPGINLVERFDTLKADVKNAREKFWGDYMVNNSSSDITVTNITLLPFEDIVESFELSDLNYPELSLASAVPVIQPQERKIHKVDRLEQIDPGEFGSVIEDWVYNKCKRSFLFLNDTCMFKTTGLLVREPGRFITVKGGSISGDDKFYNIWFVTSVRHIFTELKYETEVIAVRLFGNSDLYKRLVSPDRVHNEFESTNLVNQATRERQLEALQEADTAREGNLPPVGDINQTGAVDRSRINDELKDPAVQRLLFASTQAEVGGQGKVAQQAYIETVTNRALATNRTLESVLNDPGYYPASTRRKLYNKNPTNYSNQLNKVLAGSNITNYATDNASSSLAQNRKRAGNPGVYIGGEYFYNNYNGSGRGGVPAHRVWREGQIKSTKPTAS